MKLSRTVVYALQATLQLAQCDSDRPVSCNRLAASGKMPQRFLLQILRNLVGHGILESTRGVDGGYSLGRSAEEISLLEVIEAIEGPVETALPIDEGLSAESKSKLEATMGQITDHCRQQLCAVKLSHLVAEGVPLPI